MDTIRSGRARLVACVTLPLFLATLTACGGDGPTVPATGFVDITISTTGDDVDANGYELVLGNGQRVRVPVADTTIRLTLPRGSQEIRVEGLARNCRVPSNPVAVNVDGANAQTTIAVTCVMRQIAYIDDRDGDYEIYLSSLDGGPPTQLTNNSAYDGIPSWSPDGERLAFSSDRDGNQEIYVMNADGSDVQRVTNNPASDASARWSPDGTRILFQSDRDGTLQLFTMRADGSDVRQLTRPPDSATRARWSADGSRIGYSLWRGADSRAFIFTMRADGSDRRQLTFELPYDNEYRQDLDPAWSPDGTRVAFASNRYTSMQLFVMNADGTNPVQLTHHSSDSFNSLPAWSIDGKRIAYTRYIGGRYSLWLWDIAAGTSTPFISGPRNVYSSAWRP